MLILLDMDGVMIPAKGWKAPQLLPDGFPAFSTAAAEVMRELVRLYQPTVVLTTSHKSNFTEAKWNSIFEARGIYIEHLTTLPDNKSNLTRKDELLAWFATNNVKDSFIIIDDDKSLNDLPVYLKEHLVQTSSHIGLTQAHLTAIIAKHGLPSNQ